MKDIVTMSFDNGRNRVRIQKSTLEALGNPRHILMLYNKNERKFILGNTAQNGVARERKKLYNGAMNKQINLSALNDELAQVRTKKKEFLAQIERIIPWAEWLEVIKPSYYKGERGNKPYPLEKSCVCTFFRTCTTCQTRPQ